MGTVGIGVGTGHLRIQGIAQEPGDTDQVAGTVDENFMTYTDGKSPER